MLITSRKSIASRVQPTCLQVLIPLITFYSFVCHLGLGFSQADRWKNCSNWVKNMIFGIMLDSTHINIFRYRAISNSVQEVNGSHFPTWPPVKHIFDLTQGRFFSITCLKWIKCFQIDKIFIVKSSYVLTELFTAIFHCWEQNNTKIFQTSARSEVHSAQSSLTG